MPNNSENSDAFAKYLCIAYKDIYGNAEKPSFQELFSGIPTKVIVEVISHFMALIHTDEMDFQKQIETLKIWIGRLPSSDISQLQTALKKAQASSNDKVLFFTNTSSLYFLEMAVSHYCEGEPRNLSPDEELRLFKAYLLITEQWTENQANFLTDKKVSNDQEALEYILPFLIPYYEIQTHKDFRWQIIKAIYFFKFLEQNNDLGRYLQNFLGKFHAENWFEFLKHILTGYVLLASSNQKASIITVGDEHTSFRSFLNELSIDVNNFTIKEDFLSLREKPIFKMSESSFAFFNFNFMIDKLFQSIQFDFANILQEQGVVSNFGDFKSRYYSKEFSERFLLYGLIDYLIGKRKLVKLNGDQLAQKIGEEGPDYYIRFGNKIFVIEFKDVLMAAKAKLSYDFSKLKEDIYKKLVVNERGSPKGVSQLYNFITKLSKDGFEFDKFDASQARIYPVLIVTDSAYNSFGINWQLNNEFRKMFTSPPIGRVNDVIVVHLDTLLRFQDEFHDRKFVCADSFDAYELFTKKSGAPFDKFLSYSQFLPDYLKSKGIELSYSPRIIMKEFGSRLPTS